MNTNLFLLINGWAGHSALLDKLMVVCARYLIYGVFLAAAGLLAFELYRRRFRPVVWFVAALAVSFGLSKVAARLYSDNRPFVDHHVTQLVAHAAGKSFPSDHTTAAVAIALGILCFTRFKSAGWILLAAALLIGFARIFCGIHYPVDIAGGVATSAIGVLLVWLASRALKQPAATSENA